MFPAQTLHRDLVRLTLRAVLALFFLPLIVWGFSQYVLMQHDAQLGNTLEQKIHADQAWAAANPDVIALYRANPPSRVCASDAPVSNEYRQAFCEPLSAPWQFFWARRVGAVSLLTGALLLLAAGALGLAAFRGRRAQYRSVVLAWRVLAFSGALEVVLQSAMLVWLSFWVTAWFFEVYFIKLVIIAGILAGLGAFAAVAKIFVRSQGEMSVEGELIPQSDAPALWERIRALAEQLGTAPPDQIVAGIDSNFFVTEAPLQLGAQLLNGRTLFVSLPLLRVLDQGEADAILAHELAHLSGGDTASSAALGPKLVQFDRYCHEMSGNPLTLIAYYLLSLYRIVFELAWKRDSREREFLADQTAAQTISGEAVTRSLIKVIAYSTYRAKVEEELFSRQSKHDESIGIAAFVAQGLHPFAGSGDFASAMASAHAPHPFDTHPSLEERIRNVGSVLQAQQFGAVMTADVATSWTSRITTAEAIESRLWADYEARFAQAHEHELAYRYLPQDQAERDVVEKYFPSRVFAMKGDLTLIVDCDGVQLPGELKALGWDAIANIEYEDGYGSDLLKLTLTEKNVLGHSFSRAKLPGIEPQREQLKAALGQYWHRHKIARGQA